LHKATLTPSRCAVPDYDGDIIYVAGGERLRLAGLDAPEYHQVCLGAGGEPYAAGAMSRRHLVDLIGGRDVVCQYVQPDVYDWPIVACAAAVDSVSLNTHMVRDWWASSA